MNNSYLENESLYRGRYRVLRKIGQGGSSRVYMGFDNETGKTVTIKLPREYVLSRRDLEEAAAFETALLSGLDHAAIPKVVEVYEDAIVLEHVPGNSLEKVLKKNGALPEKEAVRIGRELLEVLGYLHGRKNPVIYRDLKPANIIVRPDGHISLIDFGAAREYSPSDEADTLNLGTCGFAAPEQYGNLGQTDVRTDIYCFGRTMLQMLTAGAGSVRTPVSPELMAVIEKCTRADRSDRFDSCREIDKALCRYPRAVTKRKVLASLKAAVVAAILALMITAAVTHNETVRSYAAEDAQQRLPAVKQRLGNAGLRIRAVLYEGDF